MCTLGKAPPHPHPQILQGLGRPGGGSQHPPVAESSSEEQSLHFRRAVLGSGSRLPGLKSKPCPLLAGGPQAGPLTSTCGHFLLCLIVRFYRGLNESTHLKVLKPVPHEARTSSKVSECELWLLAPPNQKGGSRRFSPAGKGQGMSLKEQCPGTLEAWA